MSTDQRIGKIVADGLREFADDLPDHDLLDWLRRNWRQDGPRLKQLNSYYCRRDRRWVIWQA